MRAPERTPEWKGSGNMAQLMDDLEQRSGFVQHRNAQAVVLRQRAQQLHYLPFRSAQIERIGELGDPDLLVRRPTSFGSTTHFSLC